LIGLQEIVIDNNINVKQLATELDIEPSAIWRWFNVNKVPKKYLGYLSEKFKVDESYFNEIVNNISTYKPRNRGFSNDYKIDGDITYIYIVTRKQEKFTTMIDTEDLPKLIEADLGWHIRYDENTRDYYVRSIKISYDDNNNKKIETILLHKLLGDYIYKNKENIHHKNHNTLDNRKENLELISITENSRHRKGKNKNNTTGYRNVMYNKRYKNKPYHVQLQIDGKNKVLGKFSDVDEAGTFAEEMRQKYYGEYAGKG